MRTFVERDYYGLWPLTDDHLVLLQSLQLHITRHKRGAIFLQPPIKARLEHYIQADQEVPRNGIRMEWSTLIPVINALTYTLETKSCPAGTVENTQQMIARLALTGHTYLNDFLDEALEPHLADIVDQQFFDVRVD